MGMKAIVTVALLATTAGRLSAQDEWRLDREREIRLAMSAGPLPVSSEADVYVLGQNGFERALQGTNGFACMVIRNSDDWDFLAPHCFSPDAVRSVLPAKLEEGRLQRSGLSQADVQRTLSKEFGSGALSLPSGDAYAYMLSSGQRLGPAGSWKPHFMLYMPYATNDDVGGVPDEPAYPFIGPVPGDPHSTLVIVMTEFVDPADVVLRR